MPRLVLQLCPGEHCAFTLIRAQLEQVDEPDDILVPTNPAECSTQHPAYPLQLLSIRLGELPRQVTWYLNVCTTQALTPP